MTTLAVALGLVWPGARVVVEAGPSGGVLTFRMRHAETCGMLGLEPSVASLAAASRVGLPADALPRYAQPTSLRVEVIPGALSAERYQPLRTLWPRVAGQLAGWPGTVLADLGRLQPGSPVLPLAQAATVVVLLGRGDAEGLFGLRERAADLVQQLGDPARSPSSLAVVVTAPAGQAKTAVRSATQLFAAAGVPVPVAGFWAWDPPGAAGLWAGQVTRRVAGSDLIRSARTLAETILGWWPHLAIPDQPGAATQTATEIATETVDSPTRSAVTTADSSAAGSAVTAGGWGVGR